MYRRMMQHGVDLLHFNGSVLTIGKPPLVRNFGRMSVGLFACFPFGMIFFMIFFFFGSGGKSHFLQPSFLLFLGGALLFFCLFSLLGIALFVPYATSYLLTINLIEKRWTLERRFGRWRDTLAGSTSDFGSVCLSEDSEYGHLAWLKWKDKRQGSVMIAQGDKPLVKAQWLAQEVATALGLPLVDRKGQPIPLPIS